MASETDQIRFGNGSDTLWYRLQDASAPRSMAPSSPGVQHMIVMGVGDQDDVRSRKAGIDRGHIGHRRICRGAPGRDPERALQSDPPPLSRSREDRRALPAWDRNEMVRAAL